MVLSRRIVFFILVTAFALLGVSSQAAGTQSLNELRVWESPERTRVVMEFNQKPAYKYFGLSNPRRLVIDLLQTTAGPNTSVTQPTGQILDKVRTAQFNPTTARVVFDLARKVKFETALLEPVNDYPYRLVFDLYPTEPLPKAAIKPVSKPKTQTSPSRQTATIKAAPRTSSEDIVVAIDPGHGGEDFGARGKRSKEKDIVLQIAKRLKKKIDATPGMRAVLTRSGDYFVRLEKRKQLARKVKPDLFVSIHADGFIKKQASGSSVFALSLRGASSTEAKLLADKENAADLMGGVKLSKYNPDVRKVLVDMQMDATIEQSILFAKEVHKELVAIGKTHKRHVERANFSVLRTSIPSILVETAFITNPQEEKLLRSHAHQEKLAQSILNGMKRYLKSSNRKAWRS